jgi:hypothetical protein
MFARFPLNCRQKADIIELNDVVAFLSVHHKNRERDNEMKKYWILAAITVAILLKFDVTANEKTIEKAESKANVADKTANPTDVEVKQLREQIRSLEATIAKLKEEKERDKIPQIKEENWFLRGLRSSLVGLRAICINIEDVPLKAIQYGLTKENIVKVVESQLKYHNIKTFYYPRDSKSKNMEIVGLYFNTLEEPQLYVEVDCTPSDGEMYQGCVTVAIKRSLDRWGPEETDEEIKERFEVLKKQGIRGIKETIKGYVYTTSWERTCLLTGKLDNFAEDEKNMIERLVGEFIDDYLAANPKGQFVTTEEKNKKPKDN